ERKKENRKAKDNAETQSCQRNTERNEETVHKGQSHREREENMAMQVAAAQRIRRLSEASRYTRTTAERRHNGAARRVESGWMGRCAKISHLCRRGLLDYRRLGRPHCSGF